LWILIIGYIRTSQEFPKLTLTLNFLVRLEKRSPTIYSLYLTPNLSAFEKIDPK
jgi:hypothetical protein